jgi:hypothetical protein
MPQHMTHFLELEHAWIDRPLGPQRITHLDGTADDRAGSLGDLGSYGVPPVAAK